MAGETAEARLKRLAMRSWRRGTKEMDLVLGPYADAHLAAMGEAELVAYDLLLDENDQDLSRWVMGQQAAPDAFAGLIGQVSVFARGRLRGI
ncbi:MAG: succinate dehydrogenase assembly factor 2 [Paracoccaceae bacterium]